MDYMQQPQPAYPVGQPVPQPGQAAMQSGQISPETVQAILALQQQQGTQQQVQRQLAQAQALRQQGLQPAQATSPGGGRVGAPNWAGTLANIYAAKKGQDMQDDADVQARNMGAQRQDALRRYFEALSGQKQGLGQGAGYYYGGEGE